MTIRQVCASFAVLAMFAPGAVWATSLDDAIAHALKTNPDTAEARANTDFADAKVREAWSAALPQVSLRGEVGHGRTDLGGFFGFGKANVDPRTAQIELRENIFSGGAVVAGIDQAKQDRIAAGELSDSAKARLIAKVAEAYGDVLYAGSVFDLSTNYLSATNEVAHQARLRFNAGEIPKSELAQAEARHAEGRAGLEKARELLSNARAHYRAVVGEEPGQLDALPGSRLAPAELDALIDAALQDNPDLRAAAAAVRSARAGLRAAEAERLPSVALVASAATTRDEFFPGYRADGTTIGVQGHWTLFSSGGVSARISEARASLRKSEAEFSRAQSSVREGVIAAWSALTSIGASEHAVDEQVTAQQIALDSIREEVRVGQKTTLDRLNAERDLLDARSKLAAVKTAGITALFRLQAMVGHAL